MVVVNKSRVTRVYESVTRYIKECKVIQRCNRVQRRCNKGIIGILVYILKGQE